MFTDIVDSTKRALKLGDRRWRELLDQHDRLLRQEIARFRGREASARSAPAIAGTPRQVRGLSDWRAVTVEPLRGPIDSLLDRCRPP